MEAVPSSESEIKHVHFIPVSRHPTPRGLVHHSLRSTIAFSLVDATRAHKSSSKLASEHASLLLGTSVQAILCGHFESHTLVYVVLFDGEITDRHLTWATSKQAGHPTVQLMLSLAIATALSFAAPPCDIALVSELLAPDSAWRTAQEDVINMAVHLGASLPKRIAAKLAPRGGTAAKFATAVDENEVAATILRAAIQLESTQVEAKTRASYLAWADCIKPLHVSDIPVQMYEELDSFTDVSLSIESPSSSYLSRAHLQSLSGYPEQLRRHLLKASLPGLSQTCSLQKALLSCHSGYWSRCVTWLA